ncbi:MAG: hypothetical protein A4S09_07270 [Proteobacteria bacterium SG_bin7]|nr:MAG: hypothetical protein A4S09_07270 [Proteobacteria bacterium SG_bin7]
MDLAKVLGIFLVFFALNSQADEYGVIRRVVVFPIQVPEEFIQASESAWWDVRERFTTNKRFLLASKYFMQKKDVFQPRGSLTPADAIILGKLLDAHALVVTFMVKNTLKMVVYSGEDGSLFWRQQLALHQSVRVSKQLSKAAVSLANDFIASIPYQGVQIVDPIVGQSTFDENGKTYAKIEVGAKTKIAEGDQVQWVRLTRINLEPLFGEGGRLSVFAEGRVARLDGIHAIVELLRAKNVAQLNEGDLARFPLELKHLKDELAMEEELQRRIEPEFISSDIATLNSQRNKDRPLASSIAWISGILAYLLLAF